MSVLIVSKRTGGKILYARIGVVIDGVRYLHVCRQYEDGQQLDDWTQMPAADKPMTVVPNVGGDLDDAYLKDIVQSVEGRRAGRWMYEKNITTVYHEFNAMRAAEMKGERQFALNTKGETDGKPDTGA